MKFLNNKMKKTFFILILILILGWGYLLRDEILKGIRNWYRYFLVELPQIQSEIPEITTPVEWPKQILPPPLKLIEKEKEGFLTKDGIIKFTNLQREKYGLTPLRENILLNKSAELKIKDMFENQYFDHTSPTGVELKDLIKKVGYDYILIGENLAMGNFKDDEDLVLAWMKSEGHRENILNEKYEEIGVAVEEGYLEGKKVWLAVQHFGKPLSSCPEPDENLKLKIEENEKILGTLSKEIEILRKEIERGRPKWELKEKIEKYNNLVERYNLLLKETQILISRYNNQVRLFNQCVSE